ncbi:AAA family ATPase [Luteolibacter yonseiensis]|uniref:AAA family ATPase n=1 Tax=Luteolibacter yonseiensis TaxID=1144680 RepID=A0A934R581_9BACT|nr:FtsK/SpoIIIE domain-containing protein [Luteolibacter yonseiensis]MBK1817197.1 AAA family ATPase [Luteolibacter yonseiensis]
MQTASESIAFGAVRAQLGLLESAIAAVTESERELIRNRAERHTTVRREIIRREEGDAGKAESRLRELASQRTHDLELEDAAYETRKLRIQTAYHAGRSSLSDKTQGAKDRRIGQVHGTIMRNRQAREQELAEAKEAHLSFQKLLDEDRTIRRELRKSVLAAFRSYRPLLESRFHSRSGEGESGVPDRLRQGALDKLADSRNALEAARGLPLPKFFRYVPMSLLLAVIAGMHVWYAMRPGAAGFGPVMPSLVISAVVVITLWLIGLLTSLATIRRAAASLNAAGALEVSAEKESAARLAALETEIHEEHEAEGKNLSETFRESDTEWKARLAEGQQKLERQFARLPAMAEKLHVRRLAKIAAAYEQALVRARSDADERTRMAESARARLNEAIDANVDAKISALSEPWAREVIPTYSSLVALENKSHSQFPAWTTGVCENWTPPADAPDAVRIGGMPVDVSTFVGGLPHDARLALPDAGKLSVPFSLGFPEHGSLLLESDGAGEATRVLGGIALRLLAAHPPGRASFVFIDPVGLGKDFAGLMHLADYEETLIHHRIWTQGTQIEERLAELNEHIEKVIQMYLRNEYATLAEYNEQAGTIAEKSRFLVIAGFPAAFSETACRRLLSIASSGPRCGVHLLIQRDMRVPFADVALEHELRRACLRVGLKDGVFHLADAPHGADVVVFDPPPTAEDAVTLVHRIGKASIDSNRVQVPFSHIAPPAGEVWKSVTTEELRVPIGRTGAKKLQMLAIGKGTRQHALVAGKTGSGKSTLFHVIITNLALWSSPEEVEFYLIDFKKGVEFKCYAEKQLPHARVIAIESDRAFALSVLQRIDAELKHRGELFRKAGAQDLAGYKRAPGHEPMPRSLLLIDEFQEFFTEDDAVAQEASLLLDRIVRQGRAFGIHVILGSQTLGGAYTLARATLGQMVIRIALQCNEADAHLIMDDDNPAPRMLTRPGEGIYNDQAGALAANSPFQIVWLPEDERDAVLDQVNALARKDGRVPQIPLVFEGNAPADIRANQTIKELRTNTPTARPVKARSWLGAPNSIKGPTEAVFQRQSGSHLLAVGQSSERALSLLAISIVALAAQYPAGQVEFVVLDPHAYDNGSGGCFQKIASGLSQKIRIGGLAEIPSLLGELASELEARAPSSGRAAPEVFLIIHDLQRFKSLRPDDEFRFSMDEDSAVTPAQALANLLGEGGAVGMHVLASIDTWNNVSRWIPRKLLAEFEMRVLFQMSAGDSSNLIDSPAAATLGLHRALFHNEHHGTLETFRPYAMPDDEWLAGDES